MAEIEATARLSENLSIDAGLSLLDATYGEYFSQGDDFTGNRLPQSPEVTFNAAANYRHPLPQGRELVGSLDAAYSSKVYFGAQAGWQAPDVRIELGLFGRNLFDETCKVSISNIDSVDLHTLNRPRSLCAYLRYRY